jgi:hypothetical protein
MVPHSRRSACSGGTGSILNGVLTGNRTCKRLEAASSPRPHPVILLSMKFKLFIGTVAFAMLVLAVAGWAVDGLRWALPARA